VADVGSQKRANPEWLRNDGGRKRKGGEREREGERETRGSKCDADLRWCWCAERGNRGRVTGEFGLVQITADSWRVDARIRQSRQDSGFAPIIVNGGASQRCYVDDGRANRTFRVSYSKKQSQRELVSSLEGIHRDFHRSGTSFDV